METKQRKVFLSAPFRFSRDRWEYTGRKSRQATAKDAITKRTVLEHAEKGMAYKEPLLITITTSVFCLLTL